MECEESEVLRYYLKCELGKCFEIWKQPEDFVNLFERGIDGFPDEFAIKLMRFLSGPEYRNNGLYYYLGREQYQWEIEKVFSWRQELGSVLFPLAFFLISWEGKELSFLVNCCFR